MASWRKWGRTAARTVCSIPGLRPSLRVAARNGALPGKVWKRLPVEATFNLDGLGARFRYASTAPDGIGRTLYWQGVESWEPESTAFFVSLARHARWVLDVGANTGIYTLLARASNPEARVLAFEPVPRIFQLLEANVRANGWEDSCRCYQMAVSSEEGTAHFRVPDTEDFEIPARGTLDTGGFQGQASYLLETRITTLNGICPDKDAVDLVKIDVEGFEDRVLEGMGEILERSAPALLIECLPDGPIARVDEILGKSGYERIHLTAAGPKPRDRIVPDPKGIDRNYLFLRRGDPRRSLVLGGH